MDCKDTKGACSDTQPDQPKTLQTFGDFGTWKLNVLCVIQHMQNLCSLGKNSEKWDETKYEL